LHLELAERLRKAAIAMYHTDIFFSFIVILFGALIGLYFNFLKGEPFKHSGLNIFLGVTGSCIGLIAASMLPVLETYRLHVVIALSMLSSLYFVIGYWMISEGTTPISRKLNAYRRLYRTSKIHRASRRTSHKHPRNLPAA
jgi:hypothetical protein